MGRVFSYGTQNRVFGSGTDGGRVFSYGTAGFEHKIGCLALGRVFSSLQKVKHLDIASVPKKCQRSAYVCVCVGVCTCVCVMFRLGKFARKILRT